MRNLGGVFAAAIIGMLATGELLAQDAGLPGVGRLLKVETWSGNTLIGTREAARADSLRLHLRADGDFVAPMSAIYSVATWGATDWKRGAKRGFLVGGTIGVALIGWGVWWDTHSTKESFIPATVVVAPVAVGVTVVGTAVGLLLAPDGWGRAIIVGAGSGGATIGLNLGRSRPR